MVVNQADSFSGRLYDYTLTPALKAVVWVVMSPDSTWIMKATHYDRTLISVGLMTPTIHLRSVVKDSLPELPLAVAATTAS